MLKKLRQILQACFVPHGRHAFIASLPSNAKLLDVGCGNSSPERVKRQRPDLYYIGLDICDYNQQNPRKYANEYLIVEPQDFCNAIEGMAGKVDGIISAHNIEHCYEPERALEAMLNALRPGGRLYMTFPSEESVHYPSRTGSLNFYDDPTHSNVPNWKNILQNIRQEGFEITFAQKRFRPLPLWVVGLLIEPISRARHKVMPGTWALYGFESKIEARRPV
jgi:SAM-dependent methyltransferase